MVFRIEWFELCVLHRAGGNVQKEKIKDKEEGDKKASSDDEGLLFSLSSRLRHHTLSVLSLSGFGCSPFVSLLASFL